MKSILSFYGLTCINLRLIHMLSKKTDRNYGVLIAFLISAILVIINVLRIVTIPATHDEVIFFTAFNTSYSDIINFNVIVTANVHPLSFIATKFFTETFSNDMFFLRLSSLLSQIIYLFFSWRVCAYLFKSTWWQVFAFILLQLNPFLFDFWALNRGYSMAIAFMTVSIYYLLRFANTRAIGNFSAALLAAVCAGYSNFALLYYYIAFAAILMLISIYYITKHNVKKLLAPVSVIIITVSLLLYGLIASPIQKLRDANELYYGGQTGFFSDTVVSLTKESLFVNEAHASIAAVVGLFAAISMLLNGVYLVIKVYRQQMTPVVIINTICWLLLMLPAIAITVQFHLSGTRYLTDRTALFFYVLFALTLSTWMYAMAEKNNTPATHLTIPALLLLVLTVYNFAANISLTETRQWAYDANSIAVLERMKTSYKGHKIHFTPWWIFEPSLNYYIITQYSTYFDTEFGIRQESDPEIATGEYCYIPVSYMRSMPTNFVVDTYFTVKNTDMYDGKFVLMKKVNKAAGR